VVILDGEQLRHSCDHNSGNEAIRMVSAWAMEGCLVLRQAKSTRKIKSVSLQAKCIAMLFWLRQRVKDPREPILF
jgi:hypothetical protein